MSTDPTPGSLPPVVFVHGLWLHSTSWTPWVELFGKAGYRTLTPEWPGVPDSIGAARRSPEGQAGKGISAIVDHYSSVLRALDRKPILVGHSFGGLIAQNLLGRDLAAAAIAIDPAPIKGVRSVPLAQLRSGFPVLRSPGQPEEGRIAHRRAIPLCLRQRDHRAGIHGPVRRMDDPGPGQAAVRGSFGELHQELPRCSCHPQCHPGSTAADLRRTGPHRAGRRHSVNIQAVQGLWSGDRAAAIP